jgi:hypothetical protein
MLTSVRIPSSLFVLVAILDNFHKIDRPLWSEHCAQCLELVDETTDVGKRRFGRPTNNVERGIRRIRKMNAKLGKDENTERYHLTFASAKNLNRSSCR